MVALNINLVALTTGSHPVQHPKAHVKTAPPASSPFSIAPGRSRA